jgi:hypothetical protein
MMTAFNSHEVLVLQSLYLISEIKNVGHLLDVIIE